jgi:hypothetical protein
MDHTIATKAHYNWAPSVILVAFCTIFQAGPVGTGLGVKFGRNLAQNRKHKCTFSFPNRAIVGIGGRSKNLACAGGPRHPRASGFRGEMGESCLPPRRRGDSLPTWFTLGFLIHVGLGDFTLGGLIHGFCAGRKSSIFYVWAAPATPKNIPGGGGLHPPPFGMVLGVAGAAQTPKSVDLQPAPKPCIKNLGF